MIRETDAFFGPESPLRRAVEFGGRPYEERPQQLRMAQETAAHLQAGTKVCIEAPTGVGKTFAYLVPAIHFALENECPVVVSTHTISLQEQIVEKDVPLLEKLLELEFTAVLAKGRSNYICLRRLNAITGLDQQLLAGGGLLSEIEQICRWAQDTRDGTRGDLPFVPDRGLWQSICCEVGNCLNANCDFFPRCHLMRARRRLQSCQLIIVNHALFFSDLSMKLSSEEEDAGVLPAYGAVILDEGQTLEDCASNHLGLRVSSTHLKYVLNRLYNEQRDRGLLADLMFTDARLAVADCARKTEAFFRKIVDWMEPQRQNPLRYATPGHIPSFLDDPLRQLETELEKLASDNADQDERRQEIGSLAQLLHGERMAMHDFFNMTEPGHVYWLEYEGRERDEVSLNAVPIAIGPLLDSVLFSQDIPIVVTSATLAVRGSMEYFQKRIGAERADAVVLDSPFDFESQVTVHIPPDMPSPKDSARFTPAAVEQIRKYILQTHGKAFVLFTSYSMLHDIAAEMQEFFDDEGIRLMIQGEKLSRSRMLEAFRKDVDSVIFGTASFWTGVDVPGEALSNVIILRLPFAVPDHPLVAARQEEIESRGRSSFRDYSLPEAILRFRQGFGRLIRSREDHGIVVVLDNRIVSANYGRSFLESIPKCTVEIG